jgi:hypothetical protein
MKITKRQLKRIIREEKQKLLREDTAEKDQLIQSLDQFITVLDEQMGYGVPNDELKAEVYKIVDEYFKQMDYEGHGESGGWDSGDQENWENTQRAAGHGDIQ